MDGFKEILSFLGAVIGLISAMIPLLGYMADRRRRSNARTDRMDEFGPPTHPYAPAPEVVHAPRAFDSVPKPAADWASFEKAKQLVRAPAIFTMIVGSLTLAMNLAAAGYGYIDAFVTPLGDRPAFDNQSRGPLGQPISDSSMRFDTPESEHGVKVLVIVCFLFFSVVSAAGVWSGYNMLRLRNYWLALAGSVALIPATLTCCLLGLPSGIWSMAVLLKPDVSSTFR